RAGGRAARPPRGRRQPAGLGVRARRVRAARPRVPAAAAGRGGRRGRGSGGGAMIWVTWRQYRPQALTIIGVMVAVAAYGLVLGLWMRSSFAARGLGPCLAGSGGAGCGAAIAAFSRQFTGGPTLPLTLAVFAIPPVLGAVTGAPLLGQELERGTWQLAWTQTVPRTRWLVAKLGLVTAGLVAFGVAVTAVMTWAWGPLDLVSVRLTLSPFNFEGVALTCSVL